MSEDRPKDRLISIDALRGLAAIGVVIYHSVERLPPFDLKGAPSWLGASLARAPALGWTGVMLFFVISGFCIHLKWARDKASGFEKNVDFIPFWKRRARRLTRAEAALLRPRRLRRVRRRGR